MFQKIGKGYINKISNFLGSVFQTEESKTRSAELDISSDDIYKGLRVAELIEEFGDEYLATHTAEILNKIENSIDLPQNIFSNHIQDNYINEESQIKIASYLSRCNLDILTENEKNKRDAEIIVLASNIKSAQLNNSGIEFVEVPDPFIVAGDKQSGLYGVYNVLNNGKPLGSGYPNKRDAIKCANNQTSGESPLDGSLPQKTHGKTTGTGQRAAAQLESFDGRIASIQCNNDIYKFRVNINPGNIPTLIPLRTITSKDKKPKYKVGDKVRVLYRGKYYTGTVDACIIENGELDHYNIIVSGKIVHIKPSKVRNKVKPEEVEESKETKKTKKSVVEGDVGEVADELGVDFDEEEYDIDDLIAGCDVEMEHTDGEYANVDDLKGVAQIALTHLEEDGGTHYYDELEKLEKKIKGMPKDKTVTAQINKYICNICGKTYDKPQQTCIGCYNNGTVQEIESNQANPNSLTNRTAAVTVEEIKDDTWYKTLDGSYAHVIVNKNGAITYIPYYGNDYGKTLFLPLDQVEPILRQWTPVNPPSSREIYFTTQENKNNYTYASLTNRTAQEYTELGDLTDYIHEAQSIQQAIHMGIPYKKIPKYVDKMENLLNEFEEYISVINANKKKDYSEKIERFREILKTSIIAFERMADHLQDQIKSNAEFLNQPVDRIINAGVSDTIKLIINSLDKVINEILQMLGELEEGDLNMFNKYSSLTNRTAQEVPAPTEPTPEPAATPAPEQPKSEQSMSGDRRTEVINSVGSLKNQITETARAMFKIDLDDRTSNEILKKVLDTTAIEIASATAENVAKMYNPELAQSSGPKRGPHGQFI